MFKFAAIKEGVGRFIDYLGKLPFLKEKWDAFTAYIGGLKQSLVEKWDQFTAYISEMSEYVSGIVVEYGMRYQVHLVVLVIISKTYLKVCTMQLQIVK